MPAEALLEVRSLVKHYPVDNGRGTVHACEDISFSVASGETFGIIGESGSGKTTLGRCLVKLVSPTSGSIRLGDTELADVRGRELRRLRRRMHIVFQEPLLSMNPRLPVGYQITEPLRTHEGLRNRSARRAKAQELLALVDLPPGYANAYPSALSGGELQRCSIARALSAHPDLVVLDEATSALPPATRLGIVDLLGRLQRQFGLTYIVISHDLGLVRSICDRVAVMYLGQIVEIGTREEVLERPAHPYTRALIAAEPSIPTRLEVHDGPDRRLSGEIPSPVDLPPGCHLAGRCPEVTDRCVTETQVLAPATGPDHLARCWRATGVDSRSGPQVP